MQSQAVSIIVPVYKEVENLPTLLERIGRLRHDKCPDLEVVLVDDNSQDGTEQLIQRMRQPWIRLIVRTDERGLSSAVLRGMSEATGEILVVMDADLSHPPEVIPELIARLNDGADFVIGSRYVAGGSTDDRWGVFRWANSKVATVLARPFTRACDPMSGFFALRRSTYEHASELNPIGYKIGLELLVKCGCKRIEEVPIHFADRLRGTSKLNAREQLRYMQHVGRLLKFSYPRQLVSAAWLFVMLAFLAPSIMFLQAQSYYVDETTQLSGLTLNPVEVVKWLSGVDAHRFGVPPDRSPPMSYWAGWLWSQVFGLSELSMRCFGLCCAAGAVSFVFFAARRAWGLGAAFAAGMLVAISPNMIVNAVEIRPYPLFLLFSAGGFYFLIGLFTSPVQQQWRWCLGLGSCCMLAMYTHFYGVVLSGGLITAALAMALWSRTRRVSVVCAAEAVVVAAAGLWPFVTASFTKSGGNSLGELPGGADLVRYVYRGLFGHPAISLNITVTAIAMLTFCSLAVASLLRNARSKEATAALWLALGAGMTVVVATSCLFSAFDALHPSYNLWRLPAFALIIGSVAALTGQWTRRAALACTAVLIACSAYGTVQLVKHKSYFANGPHRQIAKLIELQQDEHLAIVHEQNPDWGSIYFPIRFVFGATMPQLIADEQSDAGWSLRTLPDGNQSVDFQSLAADRVLVIRSKEQNWYDLAAHIKSGDRSLPPSQLVTSLRESTEWREIQSSRFISFLAAEVHVFERVEPVTIASTSP